VTEFPLVELQAVDGVPTVTRVVKRE